MAKSRSTRVTKAEKARRAARRAELRAEKKRAEEALRRKRSRAAKKGWATRKAKKTPKKSPKVKTIGDDTRKVSAKKGWKTREQKSIVATAEALRKVFPRALPRPLAIRRAMLAPHAQRTKFLADPSFENLQDLAGDDEYLVDVDGADYNALWYH